MAEVVVIDPPVTVPPVLYYPGVLLSCNGDGCPDPEFTASFPETQRVIPCPSCGREVFTPERYRGMP